MPAIQSILLAAALGTTLIAGPVARADQPATTAPAAPAAPAAPSAAAAEQLAALAAQYYDTRARFDPVSATFFGDHRFDHLLPMTIAPSVRARRFGFLNDTRDVLMRIDRGQLRGTDITTFDLLLYEVNEALRFEPFKDHLMPLHQMDALPVTLAVFGSGQASQPIGTVAQYDAYLRRVMALPAWIDAAIANMRQGMQVNVVLPKAMVVALLPQIKTLAASTLENSAYYAPIRNMPASFGQDDRTRLKGAYGQAITVQVLPALGRLARFLETDYLAAARSTAGMGQLPQGAQWYRTWVAAHTTSTLSPDEIHRIGLADMARIRTEYEKTGARLGYTGKPQLLPAWLAQQSANNPFKTEEEVLQGYRALNARVLPKLPALFGTLPKAALELRGEPALTRSTASDHYTPGAPDGSRPGIFWAVVPDATRYARTTMTSLFLHEGHPGHHFQISRQQELALPKFRKFGLHTAYVEGWALYAETLGKEMGLYDDPVAYAGHLMLDMRRAARLVVDTGLHAKGWTREQTVKFLMEEAGDSEAAAINATERYMAMPGQALAYKVGAIKIMELRQRAAAALGPRFSLAKFHDAVLAEGSLPLAMLETRINTWIAEQAR